MFRFFLIRLAGLIPLLLLILTLSFFLIRSAPGNPFANAKAFPPQVVESLNRQYGLDKPIFFLSLVQPDDPKQHRPWQQRLTFQWNGSDNQYWNYLKRVVFSFDLGPSTRYADQTVNDIIRDSLPKSVALGLAAYVIALVVGLGLGILAALKQNTVIDYGAMFFAVLGVSIPSFVLGPLLILVFSLTLYWLPPARWGDFRHLILPAITLSGLYSAYIARLTRSGMLEVLRADYIRTARAKGLSETAVVFRHALRGGLLPVVSFSGPALAFLLGGTIVVEKIFLIPGLGNFFIEAANSRDYTLVMGVVLLVSVFLIVANFLVDLAYAAIDPRIRY
ncbi:MAG: ABC transporter permease [Acidobacteria bacterium]|nr:ABC transporter permease [Acidobacteriota bacterium]